MILKEREERKQRRLLEERGLLPEQESMPVEEDAEEEQHNTTTSETHRSASIQSSLNDSYCLNYVSEPSDEVGSPPEELCELLALNAANQVAKGHDEEPEKDKTVEQQTIATPSVSYPTSRLKIHSRKFRE